MAGWPAVRDADARDKARTRRLLQREGVLEGVTSSLSLHCTKLGQEVDNFSRYRYVPDVQSNTVRKYLSGESTQTLIVQYSSNAHKLVVFVLLKESFQLLLIT